MRVSLEMPRRGGEQRYAASVGYIDHVHRLARADEVAPDLRQEPARDGLADVGRPFHPGRCERTRESAASGLHRRRGARVNGVAGGLLLDGPEHGVVKIAARVSGLHLRLPRPAHLNDPRPADLPR